VSPHDMPGLRLLLTQMGYRNLCLRQSCRPDIKKFSGISDDPFRAGDGRFFADREDVIALRRARLGPPESDQPVQKTGRCFSASDHGHTCRHDPSGCWTQADTVRPLFRSRWALLMATPIATFTS
jgi:hypothetical protein